MINAKEELLRYLEETKSTIKCATISAGESHWYFDQYTKALSCVELKQGYTQEQYEQFLTLLDFDYDNGFGGQQIHGTVWLMQEETWLERGEYDGSEWWEYRKCPKVPDNLKAE